MSDEKLNFEVYQTMCRITEEKAKKTENCRGCIYHGEHQDMGATIEVCNREEDLGKAVAACDNSANCGSKLTLADVAKLKTERDAALADLKHWSFCCQCKWESGGYCGRNNFCENPCENPLEPECDSPCEKPCDGYEFWTWRGLGDE